MIKVYVSLLCNDNEIKSVYKGLKSSEGYVRKLLQLAIKNIRSATNFLTTIWTSENEANKIADFLFKNGIIIRKLNSFGWKNYLRISLGNHNENKKLVHTLKKLYG